MRCVTSVTYAIKIIGTLRGHIVPSRGIRQGDPFIALSLSLVQRACQH